MKLSTKLLHALHHEEQATGSIVTPVFQTSTFLQTDIGVHKGFHYSRIKNPTRTALENTLAVIESGKHAFSFGSGMAAIDAVTRLLKPGDEVIVTEHLYGGTFRLFNGLLNQNNIKIKLTDLRDASNFEKLITPQTKMVWVETPTNPVLQVIDLKKVADITKRHQLLMVVDNTFATPCLQRPLELGADIVVHSATKYLGGHSDVIQGAVICNEPSVAEKIHFIQTSAGAIPGPQDCFLVLRGIKTLAVRMRAHCENAMQVAEFLQVHARVRNVYYPGLPAHPGYAIARSQMDDFGGMVSFDLLDDTKDAARAFFQKTKIFVLAESLGGVESTMTHPASMSHPMLGRQEQERLGISQSLIRLSVGIEDAGDLLEDLKQALG